MDKEFTKKIINVDIRTVGDLSYFSKNYPHPENPQKEVVVTELYLVNLDQEEKETGLQAHYWVRGEALDRSVGVASLDDIKRNIEARRKDSSSLPLVDGMIPCKEYTDGYSLEIRSKMIKKGMFV